MLLLPPMRQVSKDYKVYINYGVLVLDFLKCGDMSKEKRKDIRKLQLNLFAKTYGECWAFVSPYPSRLNEPSGQSAGKSNQLPTKEVAKSLADTPTTNDKTNNVGCKKSSLSAQSAGKAVVPSTHDKMNEKSQTNDVSKSSAPGESAGKAVVPSANNKTNEES